MKIINKMIFATLMMIAIAGITFSANATSITVDQILYPSLMLTPTQAGNLSAAVDMTFNSGVLTVLLTNTSDPTGVKSAANLLASLGFNLPSGVSIVDPKTVGVDGPSSISLPPGSTISLGDTFTQNIWGWGTTIAGHFDEPGVWPVNFLLSTMGADADITFGGITASTMDGPGFGLLSSTGSGASQAYITPTIQFSIYLSGVTNGTELINYIESKGVVAEFGSALPQGQITPPQGKVPEPITLILYGMGFAGVGLYRRLRRRK